MRLEALHKKNLVKAKRIIVDSIIDHLVPQVDTEIGVWFLNQAIWREEHKLEYDFEKIVKGCEDHNVETIQSYFTRASQIKEQLVTIEEEVENAEVVIATLNGLPRSWDSFMHGMCAKGKWLL